MSSNYSKNKVGDVLECIKSESIAYTKGKTYEVVEREVGDSKVKGFIGNDGLFDPFSLICSSFQKVSPTQKAVHNLKAVK